MLEMPCLKKPGLKVFTPTSDQRLMLGESVFLATHFPMQLRQYRNNNVNGLFTERELLERLQDTEHLKPGNRVYILYGAAGSGKSELMAWLHLKLHEANENRPIGRIARTEFNALLVAEKLRKWLTGKYFDSATHERWTQMRRKPRTLAKLLVLRALETLLDEDELINSLYYRLVDIVEPFILRTLTLKSPNFHDEKIDLLQREEFEAIQRQTVLPVPIDFEQFRQALLDGLRDLLLEGVNIRDTLRQLSDTFAQQGQRPVLVIDDLVQSINVFASEFLDYFITLEEGNWDVVIGVTPASFEADGRGRELLNRINYLDTIDDRVTKLWLSDEKGTESYFLDEANCHQFAYFYLEAFRHLNSTECTQCPALSRCVNMSDSEGHILSPLNQPVLVRLLRGVPEGKGRVRYFLNALDSVLSGIMQGEQPEDVISKYAIGDTAIEGADERSRKLAVWYGSLAPNEEDGVLDERVRVFFDLPSIILRSQSLIRVTPTAISFELSERVVPDKSLEAISSWLTGSSVNRQLLYDLRKGTVLWLRNVLGSDAIYAPGVAKTWGVLRSQQVEMGFSPPIKIEGLDRYAGILLARSIGHAAFQFYAIANSAGDETTQRGRLLTEDTRVMPLLWAAEDYRQTITAKLEKALKLSVADFTFHVLVLLWIANGEPNSLLPGFDENYQQQISSIRIRVIAATGQTRLITAERAETILHLFDDYFRIRENLYNGWAINQLTVQYTPDQVLKRLANMKVVQPLADFRLGNEAFKTLMEAIIEVAEVCASAKPSHVWNSSKAPTRAARQLVSRLQLGERLIMEEISPQVLKEINVKAPEFYRKLSVALATKGEVRNV